MKKCQEIHLPCCLCRVCENKGARSLIGSSRLVSAGLGDPQLLASVLAVRDRSLITWGSQFFLAHMRRFREPVAFCLSVLSVCVEWTKNHWIKIHISKSIKKFHRKVVMRAHVPQCMQI